MSSYSSLFKFVASLSLCLLSFAFSHGQASDFVSPTRIKVFSENEQGSKYYRIPGVAVTNDGTIVAVADRRGDSNSDLPNVISVVSKYSLDNGQTWSETVVLAEGFSETITYGDPAIVYDPDTNTLVCVFSGDKGFWSGNYLARCGFYVSKSYDNGKTWTSPVNFQKQIYQRNWRGAFCASGSMLRLSHGENRGRIMFVANVNTNSANIEEYVREYVCYSDDLGDTWHVINPNNPPRCAKGNESKLVQLEDGSLLMSIRYPGTRMFSRSTDGGATWTDAMPTSLIAQDCNGAIMLYPSTDGVSRLLHSYVNHEKERVDVSVSLSYDQGETWDFTKKFVDGYSAYSDLCVLNDGTIGLFVEDGTEHSDGAEGGFELVFMRFSLQYLTDGYDDASVADAIQDEADTDFAYYDIAGRKLLGKPSNGFVISRKGSSAVKELIR